MRSGWIFCVVLAFICCTVPASPESLKIGIVGEQPDLQGGCSLQLPRDFAKRLGQFVFTSNAEGRAVVNINRENVPLTLSKKKPAVTGEAIQSGDRLRFWYTGPDIRVEIDIDEIGRAHV